MKEMRDGARKRAESKKEQDWPNETREQERFTYTVLACYVVPCEHTNDNKHISDLYTLFCHATSAASIPLVMSRVLPKIQPISTVTIYDPSHLNSEEVLLC